MNQSEIAKALGVSQVSVSNWTQEGLPFRQKGRRRIYDLEPCRAWALDHLKPVRVAPTPTVAPTTAPSAAGLVAWLIEAFPRCGVEPAAWLGMEFKMPADRAADAWWNLAAALFSRLVRELGADPLRMPEPAPPAVAAVAARLDKLRQEWGDDEA